MLRHLRINKHGVQVPRSQHEVIDTGVPTFDHGGKRGYWYQLSSLVQLLSPLMLFKCQCNNDYRLGFRCASTSWSKPHIMQAISVDSSDHIDFPHIDYLRLAIAQCYVLSSSLVIGIASSPVKAPAVHLQPAMCKIRKRTGVSFGPFSEH